MKINLTDFKTRIFINTSSQLLSRGFIILTSLLTTLLLRRYLGQSGYGLYVYILNFVMLLVAFTDMGLHLTTVREVAVKEEKEKTLGTAVFVSVLLLFLVLVFLLLFFQLDLLPTNIKSSLLILVFLFSFLALKEIFVTVLHSLEKLYLSSFLSLIFGVIQLLTIALVILSKKGIWEVFLYNLIGFALVLIINFLLMFRKKLFVFNFNLKQAKGLFFKAVPLGGMLVLFTIYSKIDTLLIEHFYSVAEVGVYGLCYKIYDNLVLPAAFLMNAFLPEFSKLVNKDRIALLKISKVSAFILLATSIVLFVIVYLLSPFIFKILTGASGGPEVLILRVLAISLFFAYLNHLTGYLIIALGKQIVSLKISILALLFNFVFNWFFLPVYGIVASAAITALTEFLVLFFSFLAIRKSFIKVD